MNHSQLRNIIKEEISKALSEIDPYEKGMERFKEKMGFKEPNPSVKNVMKEPNPSVKNVMKEKEFKVEFQQYINDEYDVDFITVKAKDEADALIKAKEQLKQSGKRNVRYDKLKVIK